MAEERGRPTIYTPEIAADICAKMAAGASLRSICEAEDMPSEVTVRRWAIEDREGFSTHYEEAVRLRAMRWADEVIEISDENTNDVKRARLRVDARKWLLAKVLPKVYGEKVTQVHEGGDKPVEIDVALSRVEVRERMARILRGTIAESDGTADSDHDPGRDQGKRS